MDTVRLIGLGTGGVEGLTLKAYEMLTDGTVTLSRTERHPAVMELKGADLSIETFDSLFEETDSFEELYQKIASEVVSLAHRYGTINYCTAGSPYCGDIVTKKLIDEYKQEINTIIIDGMSFLDKCIKLSGAVDSSSIKILDCLEVDEFSFDINSANIVTQVYDKDMASHLKLKLMEVYPEDCEIHKIDVLEETVEKLSLYSVDRDKNYGFSTYFCINPIEISKNTVYNVNNLCRVVKILRGPDGCPWDRKQTHESLRPNAIEEAYEVADAIDNHDDENLVEELGDLLLQVVMHAEIGSEEGYFNLQDVVTRVCRKMYQRHPHVFGDVKADSADAAVMSWEAVKEKEKNLSTYTDNLKNVPKSLSPLSRSYKVQKRAADVGFDWPDADGAVDKVMEEISEFMAEYRAKDADKAEAEFGDLLFALVNVARFAKINPDVALNRTINKFIKRFEFIEKHSTKDLKLMTLAEMDELWEKSKVPYGI